MSAVVATTDLSPAAMARRDTLFAWEETKLHRHVDRLFGLLMLIQYLGGIVAAFTMDPPGGASVVQNVQLAAILGFFIALPVWVLATMFAGEGTNRYFIAIAQMLMSFLLIHLTGGRIQTHFHVFVSLAFLGFYRDWKVLIPADVVFVAMLLARSVYEPYIAYGTETASWSLFFEHVCWVLFQSLFICAACVQGRRELMALAERQAVLIETKGEIEGVVIERTKELRESEARKVAVLESALDAILSIDDAGLIIDANRAAEGMFGRPREELHGISILDVLHSTDTRRNPEEWLSEIRESDSGVRVPAIGKRIHSEFPAEVTVSPVEMEGVVDFTFFVRDLTEQRRLEAKVAHGQKMETIGRLSTGIAHEINTPNQYIADNVRFLDSAYGGFKDLVTEYRQAIAEARSGDIRPETMARINRMEAEGDIDFLIQEIPSATAEALDGVERVRGIVRAMRDFAHPGSVQHEPVDVNSVVKGAVTVTRNEWKHVAELHLALGDGAARIMGHAGDLGQAVLNLIVNAAHAVADEKPPRIGAISVRTLSDDKFVTVEVEDDGCGIPPEHIANIFDPFYTTKGVGLGTGQGLAFVHAAVVQRMGGEVEVSSVPGKGTCFTLRFPRIVTEAVSH